MFVMMKFYQSEKIMKNHQHWCISKWSLANKRLNWNDKLLLILFLYFVCVSLMNKSKFNNIYSFNECHFSYAKLWKSVNWCSKNEWAKCFFRNYSNLIWLYTVESFSENRFIVCFCSLLIGISNINNNKGNLSGKKLEKIMLKVKLHEFKPNTKQIQYIIKKNRRLWFVGIGDISLIESTIWFLQIYW